MKATYRPDEAAQLLRVSKRSVYRMMAAGQLATAGGRVKAEELPERKVLTISEAAGELNLSKGKLNRWFWEGRLEGIQLKTGTIRLYEDSVNKLARDGLK